MDKSFLTDIKELRRRARSHIEQGAITAAYRGDRETVLRLLNEALATELVCVLRYKRTTTWPRASTPRPWPRNSSSTPARSRPMLT